MATVVGSEGAGADIGVRGEERSSRERVTAVSIADITIRAAGSDDLPFLIDMLFEAATVSAEVQSLGKEAALAVPAIAMYLDGWGRDGDAGVVAVDGDGRRLGAAWYRLFPADAPGYGFVSPDVPELAIGVAVEARGRGVGSALLRALMDTAHEQGYRALSLAVDLRNPARRLYERVGFRVVSLSEAESAATMMVGV